jgi:tetratricopeptide (TPR) repeat protein
LFLHIFLSLSAYGEVKKILLITADWCSVCQQMKYELLNDPEWKKIAASFPVEEIDIDEEKNQPLVERYNVVQLPTTVVLDGEGKVVARLESYTGKTERLTEMNDILFNNKDMLAILEQQLKVDPNNANIMYHLGRLYFLIGLEDKAIPILGKLMTKPDMKMKVVDLFARYYLRARKDYSKTIDFINAQIGKEKCDANNGTLYYWLLTAYYKNKALDRALELIDKLGEESGTDETCLTVLVEFILDYSLDVTKMEHYLQSLSIIGKDVSWIEYLHAKYYRDRKIYDKARAHIEKAIELEPNLYYFKIFKNDLPN